MGLYILVLNVCREFDKETAVWIAIMIECKEFSQGISGNVRDVEPPLLEHRVLFVCNSVGVGWLLVYCATM